MKLTYENHATYLDRVSVSGTQIPHQRRAGTAISCQNVWLLPVHSIPATYGIYPVLRSAQPADQYTTGNLQCRGSLHRFHFYTLLVYLPSLRHDATVFGCTSLPPQVKFAFPPALFPAEVSRLRKFRTFARKARRHARECTLTVLDRSVRRCLTPHVSRLRGKAKIAEAA